MTSEGQHPATESPTPEPGSVEPEPAADGDATASGDPRVPPDQDDGVERPELVIITGMSGAGRSRAATTLEDLGWFVVDNLPPKMLDPLARMLTAAGGSITRLAAVVDVRSGEFFADLRHVLADLRTQGLAYYIVFLDASDAELVRRFEQVRRAHPLQGRGRILDGIGEERQLLAHLRERADLLIDTTSLNIYDLSRLITERVAVDTEQQVRLAIMSFGFKHGLPLDADHVVDVRFLANPYWVSELRALTGRDDPVSRYVLGQPGAADFVHRYAAAIEPILPGYVREHKNYVTIAVGCTGGRHRSVAITEYLAELLRGHGHAVRTIHRDVGHE